MLLIIRKKKENRQGDYTKGNQHPGTAHADSSDRIPAGRGMVGRPSVFEMAIDIIEVILARKQKLGS